MKESTNNKYGYWEVEQIRHYIIAYLQNIFPESIIEREFDRIDIMAHGPNIPIEIQRIRLDPRSGSPQLSHFEDSTRRQIEQNIEIFEQCWLFFDTKLLHHLQNNLSLNSSLNMDWIYQFFQSGKLRVFIVNINGDIRELEDKDFEFIRKFSNTCKLGKEQEHRILQKNRSKIAYRIYKMRGITTEEINRYYKEFENNNNNNDKKRHFTDWLVRNGGRRKEIGMIKHAIQSLPDINNTLKCTVGKGNNVPVTYMNILGIIEGEDWIRCSDKYNFLDYFPGYFEMEELWDYWRINLVDRDMFYKVVRGEYPNYLKDRKRQKNIDNAWS